MIVSICMRFQWKGYNTPYSVTLTAYPLKYDHPFSFLFVCWLFVCFCFVLFDFLMTAKDGATITLILRHENW